MDGIRTDVMTREQFDQNCMNYSDFALYTPPDRFMFYHYEDPSTVFACERGVIGQNYAGDKYFLTDVQKGGYYGVYETLDITYYIKSETWIVVDDNDYFDLRDIRNLEKKIETLKAGLKAAHGVKEKHT